MINHKEPIFNLDPEEQALSDSVDRNEWVSVKNKAEGIRLAKEAATNYFKKKERINIRISKRDLDQIKQKAEFEGLPYQTLISSILHRYITGSLSETPFKL